MLRGSYWLDLEPLWFAMRYDAVKSLIEEFTVSKAFTLRKLLFLFLSTATFTYQVPLFTAGPFTTIKRV